MALGSAIVQLQVELLSFGCELRADTRQLHVFSLLDADEKKHSIVVDPSKLNATIDSDRVQNRLAVCLNKLGLKHVREGDALTVTDYDGNEHKVKLSL